MTTLPLPESFIQRLQKLVPDKMWEQVWHSFFVDKPLILRINTLRTDRTHVLSELEQLGVQAEKLAWKDDVLIVNHTHRSTVTASDLYQRGDVYSQNLSSQLAPMLLNAQPGEQALDLCAAPGGKTLQLACMMKDTGHIGAVESVKSRFFKLKSNLESQGVTCVKTYLNNGIHVWRKTPERFDRVLVDAPCSSESRFKADQPETYSHWNEKKIKEVARKQKGLLYSGIQCLKPGGTLVYSTCSFAPEENEAIVDHALNRFEGLIEIESVDMPITNIQQGIIQWNNNNFNEKVADCVRVLPDEIMDGFFLCKIRKTGSTIKAD
jgi:NOL1/NOP2/sun family putative RNA methylase